MFWVGMVVILCSACNSPLQEMALSSRDNGRQIQIGQGQTLAISLPGNPSTGYLWQVDTVDDQVLAQTKAMTFTPASEEVGASGLQTFHFQAIRSGEILLRLVYRRPWEKKAEPLKAFSIQVSVR
jgi:inhibitor of cysteine peptidase